MTVKKLCANDIRTTLETPYTPKRTVTEFAATIDAVLQEETRKGFDNGTTPDAFLAVVEIPRNYFVPRDLLHVKAMYETRGFKVYNRHGGDRRYLWLTLVEKPELSWQN